jgi:type I restriction enzyme S subunit
MREIVIRVTSLFSLADQLEARLTAARKFIERLTPALLAKAFRGELVPQDPNDEPASVLLERIRAARQAEAGAVKPSRRGRPKAAANPDQLPFDAAPVPPDFLAGLLRECGPLSERALWAVSELEPKRFQQQLYRELESGTAREVQNNGQVLLEAVE